MYEVLREVAFVPKNERSSHINFDELGWSWSGHCCESGRSDRQWARSRPREKLGYEGVRVKLSDGVTILPPPEASAEG